VVGLLIEAHRLRDNRMTSSNSIGRYRIFLLVGMIVGLSSLFWRFSNLINIIDYRRVNASFFLLPYLVASIILILLIILSRQKTQLIECVSFAFPIFVSDVLCMLIMWIMVISTNRGSLEGWGFYELALSSVLFLVFSINIILTMVGIGYLVIILKRKMKKIS